MERPTILHVPEAKRSLIIGDIHRAERYRFEALVAALRADVLGKIDTIVTLGDIDECVGYNRVMEFQLHMEREELPVYHTIGNHDEAWYHYSRTGCHQTLRRSANYGENPDMIQNKNIQIFIENMHDRIFLGKDVYVQHGPHLPGQRWPLKSEASMHHTHEFMRELKVPTLIMGHLHENFIHTENGEETSYRISKYGQKTDVIKLRGVPSIVAVGRFDEEGNVAVVDTNDQGHQEVQFHKLWNTYDAYV